MSNSRSPRAVRSITIGISGIREPYTPAIVPLNVPNALTVIRILMVPVLVVALLDDTGGGDLLAAIVFVTASVTDALDGWYARSRGSVTTFGKLMDPLADKLLIIAALVT